MIRAMFSGVTGLNAHQMKMDVVGNNVANVNTIGFRAGRVLFQEVFNQTIQVAKAPDLVTGQGGINPVQVGLGLGVSAIDTITTRGSVQRTDSLTDMSIDGEGFFIIGEENSNVNNYTRAGNFTVDKNGNLVAGNGMKVFGWNKYEVTEQGFIFDEDESVRPLNLFFDELNGNKRVISAKNTEKAMFSGNIDAGQEPLNKEITIESTDTPQYTSPFTVYDALGNEYRINLEFFKTQVIDGNTEWTVRATQVENVTEGNSFAIEPAVLQNLFFDSQGGLVDGTPSKQTITITPNATTGTEPVNLEVDLSSITMYVGGSTVSATFIDGYKMGSLVSFNVGSDGLITGIYDNGRQNPLGQIAIATFENPAGLAKVGQNAFAVTSNSGEMVKALKPGIGGAGNISPGTLEMSNVDLSKEFAEMIVTQRGFQASSRIISSSDEMLQELINLKR